jgi:hypothetical protein
MPFDLHDPEKLLRSLCDLSQEANWVEFKENMFEAKTWKDRQSASPRGCGAT